MLVGIAGCKKDFLDTKPNKALLVPQTIADFQRLLDNTGVMNLCPSLALLAGDEFYADANSIAVWTTPAERNTYIWADEIFEVQTSTEWNACYKQIFYSNIILEGLETMSAEDQGKSEAKWIKGSALFFRAQAFYNLAQVFCPPFRNTGNDDLLGLPLKLKADVNEQVQRANLSATYSQVIEDLTNSLALLPGSVSSKNRPSQRAALGLLARVNLTMQRYSEALSYANDALGQNSSLLDFNSLTATLTSTANPFPVGLPTGNDEVIFYNSMVSYSFFNNNLRVDSTIYRSYANNDLRKSVFFVSRSTGQINVKGSHAGTTGAFAGIANDELYLIRAECEARKGNLLSAMNALNQLLVKRHRTGTYLNQTAVTAEEALKLILSERRKELFRRGLRWSDLRRLNQDAKTSVVLQHQASGPVIQLQPQSLKYTFPIPPDEIIASGILQNPR